MWKKRLRIYEEKDRDFEGERESYTVVTKFRSVNSVVWREDQIDENESRYLE